MKTTRWTTPLRNVADIEALERIPYEELVPSRSIHEVFSATAGLFPDRPGLTVIPAGPVDQPAHTRTNAELLREITRNANLVADLVSSTNSVVTILCPTYDPIPALIWGAETACVVSCINYLLAPEAIVDLLLSEEAEILVVPGPGVDADIWAKAREVFDQAHTVRKILVLGGAPGDDERLIHYDLAVREYPSDRLVFEREIGRDTLAALFHTGGTTGTPKLVTQTHGAQIHGAWAFAQMWAIDETDVILNCLPMFHVGGTISLGLSGLAAGAHNVVLSPYGLRNRLMVEHYWELVERYSATIVGGVPTAVYSIVDTPVGNCDISCIRMGFTGGALCPASVAERFESRTGRKLYEQYGMTETAAMISTNPFHGERVTGSVGYRVPFSGLMVAKEDTGDEIVECEAGEIGLVLVRGPQVFAGYKDPRHNEGTLLRDHWVATGDLGYQTEDKRLILTGRKKDLIIRSGHNIDPLVIEETANSHPAVRISAAVGMPDQYAGEVPVLFVERAPGQPLDLGELETFMSENIAEPPAKPRKIIEIEALPTTVVGKIYKPQLRDLAVKEKIRQEIEAVSGPGAVLEIRTEALKSGNTAARVVIRRTGGAGQSDMETAITEAFVDLPIELRLEWN